MIEHTFALHILCPFLQLFFPFHHFFFLIFFPFHINVYVVYFILFFFLVWFLCILTIIYGNEWSNSHWKVSNCKIISCTQFEKWNKKKRKDDKIVENWIQLKAQIPYMTRAFWGKDNWVIKMVQFQLDRIHIALIWFFTHSIHYTYVIKSRVIFMFSYRYYFSKKKSIWESEGSSRKASTSDKWTSWQCCLVKYFQMQGV